MRISIPRNDQGTTKWRVGIGILSIFLFIGPQVYGKAMGDMDINDAIEDEFLLDSSIPENSIQIDTSNGVATLEGTVENLLAKERATRIAETVRGVRSVVNSIDVAPAEPRTDTEVKTDVIQALVRDPATESWEIEPEVDNGAVTLTGQVDSWQEKQLAGTIAKGVRGVQSLKNDLTIDYTETRTDREMQAEIQERLRWNVLVDDALIDVSVNDGAVTLDGIVGSAAEKRRAHMDAWVRGVDSVDASGLEIQAWAKNEDLRGDKYAEKSDTEIERAVEDALLYDPRVVSFNVSVEADHGAITLRGDVDNLKAKSSAEQTARNTVGVVQVDNRLTVTPLTVSDEAIETDVAQALIADPFVDRYKIDVNSTNGIVSLYGDVDNAYEKGQAEDVASRVNGVLFVENHLEVSDNDELYSYDPYVDDWLIDDYAWGDFDRTYSWQSDKQLKDEVEDQLFWSPFVNSDTIDVNVDDGEVHLTGTVDSYDEYRTATKNAFDAGAVIVDNDLTIQG
ncbi:MAG: BON domain-containing protein [Candidatus Omnitrophica bacterium]|nr:BON domain-containing protein [Candidatus Omnitrophota bacterium]